MLTFVSHHEVLQWGRDQLIAEINTPATFAAIRSMLQWGRDQLIAEITKPAQPYVRGASGFNGAAIS